MTRIKLSLYVTVSLLLSIVMVPVIGAQSAGAAGADPVGTTYVSDESAHSIDVFAPGTNGNVAPLRSISGSLTGLGPGFGPDDVKVDAAGDVFSSNFSGDSITEYAPGASGNVAPICTISGSNTGLDSNDDISIAPDGTIYVGNFAGNPVEVFAPGACGNVTPERIIVGSATGLGEVDGLGVDAAGNLYVDNTPNGSIEVFAPGANGNVAPVRTISGSLTGLTGPDDIVVGFGGELYVTNGFNGGASVLVFAPGATGNVAPIQDISGSNTDLGAPDDLAVDASGHIFVTDEFSTLGPAMLEYASGATGNVAPATVISGSSTTFIGPEGVAVAGPPALTGATVSTTDSATSVSLGNPTSDTATITEGSNGDSPTGSLVFKFFGPGDPTCSSAPAHTSSAQTVHGAGSYSSGSFTPTAVGTYTWQALYSGDTHNPAVTTACSGVAAETVTVQQSAAQPTSTSTSLSGGGQSGTSISVPTNTAVTDRATLSGTNAAKATGKVTYNVYSHSGCTTLAAGGTPESITTPGTLPASAPVSLSAGGTYYWQAVYSGDTSNKPSTSACGSETEVVAPAPATGSLEICKVAAPPLAGQTFPFQTATWSGTQFKEVSLKAGAPPGGCSTVNTYTVGTTVLVEEAASAGVPFPGVNTPTFSIANGTITGNVPSLYLVAVRINVGTNVLTVTNTPIPPGPQFGTFEVCKSAADNNVQGSFVFNLTGPNGYSATTSVPTGQCNEVDNVPAGVPITVTEPPIFPFALTSVSTIPTTALISTNLGASSAQVEVEPESTSTVFFTNATLTGFVKVCKTLDRSADNVLAGKTFTYSVSATFEGAPIAVPSSVSVVAQAFPTQTCAFVGGTSSPFALPLGSLVTVSETGLPPTIQVVGTSVNPANLNAGSPNSTTVQLYVGNLPAPNNAGSFGAGSVTQANFINEAFGYVEVCKSSTSINAGIPFQFSVDGAAISPVDVGNCSPPILKPVGTTTVTETPAPHTTLTNVFGTSGATQSGNSALATVPYNADNMVTFNNEINTGSLKICKAQTPSDGQLGNTAFNFSYAYSVNG